MSDDDFPRSCYACGSNADAYVVLVWREIGGRVRRVRYCASWVSEPCWNQYEAAATAVGFC